MTTWASVVSTVSASAAQHDSRATRADSRLARERLLEVGARPRRRVDERGEGQRDTYAPIHRWPELTEPIHRAYPQVLPTREALP